MAKKATRDAYGEALAELGKINDKVVEDNINRLKFDLMYNERQKIIKRRK